MNVYQWASVILALCLYIPLDRQILRGEITQNLATFILWGSLDAVAGASIYVQGGGNYQLPFAYVLGCSTVLVSILRSRNYSWTKVETRVSLAVVALSIGWWIMVYVEHNAWLATILSTLAVVAAGLPQLRDSWRDPSKSPLEIYIGYVVVNALSTIGGKGWSVEERFYPGFCLLLCATIVGASMRGMTIKSAIERAKADLRIVRDLFRRMFHEEPWQLEL